MVLRTSKKPHRGPYPGIADSLAKDQFGHTIGHVPEIEYDVLDLPARDFHNLTGGPVLRLALGILKKMTEGTEEEFPEALLPLREVSGEDRQVELTKEMLAFVAKAMAAHNKKLEAKELKRALKPIFDDRENFMIKTIFEEKYEQGLAEGIREGKLEGKREGEARWIVRTLARRFGDVPKRIQEKLYSVSEIERLDELGDLAMDCVSLNEFKKALGQ